MTLGTADGVQVSTTSCACSPAHAARVAVTDDRNTGSFETYELLLRGLLDMPNHPAVLGLQVFTLLFQTMGMGGDVHLGPAQFYDVPMVSLRNALLPDVLRNDSLVADYFTWTPKGPDVRHVSLSKVLRRYLCD
jgi:hypothetical protein